MKAFQFVSCFIYCPFCVVFGSLLDNEDEIYIYFDTIGEIYNTSCCYWYCNLKVEIVLIDQIFDPNLYSLSDRDCYCTLLKKM